MSKKSCQDQNENVPESYISATELDNLLENLERMRIRDKVK